MQYLACPYRVLFFLELLQSPGPSAVDRFLSPIANQPAPVKKQLFGSSGVKPGQSLLQSNKTVSQISKLLIIYLLFRI